LCARVVLPRLACVCARGKGTREYLDELGLDNVIDAADLAFALPEEAELPRDLAALLDEHVAERGFVLVMPSQVVANLCEKAGIDYVPGLASAVDAVNAKLGLPVVIVPHSYRSGQGRSRMNDGPVAREVAAACTAADVHLVDTDLRPGVLRAMVDRSSLLVTSRFHGMVSGMATATPTVVIGWSHKYREVMSDFGVERYGLSHEALATPSSVVDAVVDAWGAREDLHRSMRAALDGVRSAAAHNFEAVAAALPEGDRP
jgi:colanic acid/amylovoran biosynthesis protein